jgi:hypothetical protein
MLTVRRGVVLGICLVVVAAGSLALAAIKNKSHTTALMTACPLAAPGDCAALTAQSFGIPRSDAPSIATPSTFSYSGGEVTHPVSNETAVVASFHFRDNVAPGTYSLLIRLRQPNEPSLDGKWPTSTSAHGRLFYERTVGGTPVALISRDDHFVYTVTYGLSNALSGSTLRGAAQLVDAVQPS